MGRISSGKGSKQNYQTPKDFMDAIHSRFGDFAIDLAAESANAQCERYFAPVTGPDGPMPFDLKALAMDAFDQDWVKWFEIVKTQISPSPQRKLFLWLNPPFNDIEKWAFRCVQEASRGADILMLVPLGFTEWYSDHVVNFADVYQLKGRLAFIPGETYTKDCILVHYRGGCFTNHESLKILLWDWKENIIEKTWYSGR